MTRPAAWPLAALALALLGLACRSSSKCDNAPGTPDDLCYCSTGRSCAQECPLLAASCTLYCANQNHDCSLAAGDHCSALCQGAMGCDVSCRDDALVACQGTTGVCSAAVGERADVRCEGAEDCEIECTGSCVVDCPLGTCRVVCASPDTCEVRCSKGGEPAAACPDGRTKVCGAASC